MSLRHLQGWHSWAAQNTYSGCRQCHSSQIALTGSGGGGGGGSLITWNKQIMEKSETMVGFIHLNTMSSLLSCPCHKWVTLFHTPQFNPLVSPVENKTRWDEKYYAITKLVQRHYLRICRSSEYIKKNSNQQNAKTPQLLSLKWTATAYAYISKSIPLIPLQFHKFHQLHFYAAGFKAGLNEVLILTETEVTSWAYLKFSFYVKIT